jgi:hypothetical protein
MHRTQRFRVRPGIAAVLRTPKRPGQATNDIARRLGTNPAPVKA